jgi:hypothetical protein
MANEYGKLKIRLMAGSSSTPIKNATIEIASSGNPDQTIEVLKTDSDGITDNIELEAPPFEYSQSPTDNQPYSEYNLKVTAEGYNDRIITGVQIFSDRNGIQNIELEDVISGNEEYNPTVIGGHTLWEYYPPKIAEDEVKTVAESGEIVLSRVVIPETIVVHDGVPTDSTAKDYYVPYKEYIKNVASNEIYSTWPDASLRANILAIMSFTLNRVYTEWYRGKGYDFTITSSTAYDQKWIYNKTIYENISQIVDEQFANYLSRPGVTQPLFTQYCDGKRVSCPNWMTQWGSKDLAEDGLSAIEILRYFYGDSIYINSAETIAGIPASYPGYDLTIGSSGTKVKQLQEQLNRIAQNYPSIKSITADGIYGQATADAVKQFQKIFDLPATGVTNYSTWYKISQIYVGVTKIAENV